MQPPFLHGHQFVTLDGKNRIQVPAAFRNKIEKETHGKDFLMVPGSNGKPWLYPDKYYEHRRNQMESNLVAGSEQHDFNRLLAYAETIVVDAQGRALIPAVTLEDYEMTNVKDFSLLGCRDHLELWEKSEWATGRKALKAKGPTIEAALLNAQAQKEQKAGKSQPPPEQQTRSTE